ncbi:MAG: transcription-repair coupling factor [Myxococcaceae bacterium]|nr:transcription-repair coupling factor [Myxococcaceae bacterium]
MLSRLRKERKAPLLCVTADEDAAEALFDDLSFFFGGPHSGRVVLLPGDDALPWDELVPDSPTVAERLGTLFKLRTGAPIDAVVLPARALSRKVLPPEVMATLSREVTPADELGRDGLARLLTDMGYRHSPLVEDQGSFSLRGDIIDVFPPLTTRPVRLEFFGDAIESMREFDPDSQRTLEDTKQLTLLPARELFFSEKTRAAAEATLRRLGDEANLPTAQVREKIERIREGLSPGGLEGLMPGFWGTLASVFDYLPHWHPQPLVYVDDAVATTRALEDFDTESDRSYREAVARGELVLPPADHHLSRTDVLAALAKLPTVEGGALSLEAVDARPPLAFTFGETKELRESIKSHHGEEGALTPLIERLQRWREERVTCVIACSSRGQADRLIRLFADRGVKLGNFEGPLPEDLSTLKGQVLAHLVEGPISQGFIDTPTKFALLSDEDIFGGRVRRAIRRRKAPEGFTAASFGELKEGDLVVHQEFGVARYAGLTTMTVQGIRADFLLLEYAGKDKVYLPVSRLRLVSRFTGGDPSGVALDKLGSDSWAKTKARVREQLLQMAGELLKLYSERAAHPGFAFSAPDRFFRQFEADFEFEETPDQQKAIDDVLASMQKPEPMDRLVCGDVGYGKTEVAMRAAFKAVLDRKQVAVLVPTTLLAHQHYQSFVRRFDGYPVTIEVVSSLRKTADAREVLQRAREGRVDIVIGTHKLFSSEVQFKSLGLLVIDEEQRFGVKQKEQLKKLKAQVDVLTLSATPIPRTLNMAMSGLRDLSLITTPPADRRAIRTFVNRFDPGQIRDAILREVQRGGQVYFVHNRVSSIHSMEKFLKDLVPQVSIAVAHGQMPEGKLEQVMLEFVEKKHQVLLCTSIIESGIDIPTANTMIVNRADAFGLAQLYQLRGRVGRSRERAYAYLLVPVRRKVTKDAERRLEVLQTFTELGAGFSIASHDLEIRGAGNLLGAEQSGSIEAVGFDLYTQMLEEAVAEAKGEPPTTTVDPEVSVPLAAYLPDDYVPDVHQRLVLYKRLAQAQRPEDLDDLRAELVDRFGDAPPEVDALTEVMLLKLHLRALRLRGLDAVPGRVSVSLGPDAALNGTKLAAWVGKSKGQLRLTPDLKLIAKVSADAKGDALFSEAKGVLRGLFQCATR